MGDFFTTIMAPIEWLVAWIMYGFHAGLTSLGMPEASGWTWALSIVGLVIVMRAAMIPLFFKQIMASRKMQMIQPELQKIQKKYKGKTDPESRQAMTQETMALYKKEGTNPFSSCLPILAQSPFFFGLFQVLNGLDDIARGTKDFVGPIDREVAAQAESASIFGAQLSDTFLGSNALNTKIVTVILIVLMSATTFLTQRQLITKNMPASALDNPFARQQKLLLYVLPIVFAVSGINFPLGVLIYWFTTNIWSMCQQFYVIRRLPAPGSAAEKAYHARLAKKGKPIPGVAASATAEAEAEEEKQVGQRVQPTSKKRKKKQGAGAQKAAPSGPAASPQAAQPGNPAQKPGQKPGQKPVQKAGQKSGQKPAQKPAQPGPKASPAAQNGQQAGSKQSGAAAKPPTT